jgi:integrase
MTDLFNYLADRGLDPASRVASNEGVFLLGKVDDVQRRLNWAEGYDARQGISTATLYDQFKLFFQELAEVLGRSDPRGAARLTRASTHWLRHTHGSHAVAAGTPIEVVQANLGHASLATTTRYVTAEAKRRHQAIEAFWRGRDGAIA